MCIACSSRHVFLQYASGEVGNGLSASETRALAAVFPPVIDNVDTKNVDLVASTITGLDEVELAADEDAGILASIAEVYAFTF